ncbi:MAG: HYR domain-containing protein, partial [Saprospiraceae bacterium]|nr:HYR domain-containing protein [Saprospiraceae bacterium]
HIGENNITFTVKDNNGNTSTCIAVVTVEDNITPTITCPADITVTSTPENCTPQVTWEAPEANDNCSYSVSSTHNSGDEFGLGTTTVTYTVTDGSGNTAECSFNVTVETQTLEVVLSSEDHNGYNISCFEGNDGVINTTVNGGCQSYTYIWSNGKSGANVAGLVAGNYSVTVSDNSGQTA